MIDMIGRLAALAIACTLIASGALAGSACPRQAQQSAQLAANGQAATTGSAAGTTASASGQALVVTDEAEAAAN
jgi:hypothetical protein